MRATWSRIIGKYKGQEPGPLFICTAGTHGNEPSGIYALERVFNALESEPSLNPDFVFKGCIVGLAGNLAALQMGRRYIHQDLNRLWHPDNVARICKTPDPLLEEDEKELKSLKQEIDKLLHEFPDVPVVIMDLHTTSADGGIFSMATNDPESIRLASELHAPVILGMLDGIQGTTMHFFRKEVLQRDIISFAFEAGQHNDPISIDRATSAIIACARALNMVKEKDVEHAHDKLLISYSEKLPSISEVLRVYEVKDEETFHLLPNFHNFQPVQKGQLLGYDQGEALVVPEDSLILMPRYQSQGTDGYFLLRVLVD